MIFIETPVFSKLVEDLLPHDSYVELQHALLSRPDTGDVIPGSGGLEGPGAGSEASAVLAKPGLDSHWLWYNSFVSPTSNLRSHCHPIN